MKRTPLKRKTPLKRVAFLSKKEHKKRGLRIDPLDALFSEYIRKRAVSRVGGCERCLTPHTWQSLQCSHFFGRGDQSTRVDCDNAAGICAGCHLYLGGHPHEHDRWFKEHLGEEAFALLEGRNRIMGKPDRKAIELYLHAKISELEKEATC